jgi:hypothetical protein
MKLKKGKKGGGKRSAKASVMEEMLEAAKPAKIKLVSGPPMVQCNAGGVEKSRSRFVETEENAVKRKSQSSSPSRARRGGTEFAEAVEERKKPNRAPRESPEERRQARQVLSTPKSKAKPVPPPPPPPPRPRPKFHIRFVYDDFPSRITFVD